MCGYVEDGIIPGCSATKPASRASATTSRGSWSTASPSRYTARGSPARRRHPHAPAGTRRRSLPAGESRAPRARLVEWQPFCAGRCGARGLLIGATLATTAPEEIYRALIEATAYGTRVIIETFEANGVPYARGGRRRRSRREESAGDADLRRRDRPDLRPDRSDQTPALGSAMFGAVAAGHWRRSRHDRGRTPGDGSPAWT